MSVRDNKYFDYNLRRAIDTYISCGQTAPTNCLSSVIAGQKGLNSNGILSCSPSMIKVKSCRQL